LRPGDVILTYPAGMPWDVWESYAITKACGGPYSHAILVLRPTLWFESEDQGVGQTLVRVDRIEIQNDKAHELKCLDPWARHKVLRHPEAEARSDEELLSVLIPATNELSFRKYPSFIRIADDLHILEYVPLRDALLGLADESVPFDVNRGLFCSEVVAYLYGKLGLPFSKKPEQVCPSDILNPDISHLKVIEPYCESNPTARLIDPRIFNQMSEQTFRKVFVGQLTQYTTVSAAITHVAQRATEAAVRAGVPEERLTVAGLPAAIPEVLTSLRDFCMSTSKFIIAAAERLNADSSSTLPDSVKEGIRVLEVSRDALSGSTANLASITATYCEVVKPNAPLHQRWEPLLSDHFRHSEHIVNEHLKIVIMLNTDLRKALDRGIGTFLAPFVTATEQTISSFAELRSTMTECRNKIQT